MQGRSILMTLEPPKLIELIEPENPQRRGMLLR